MEAFSPMRAVAAMEAVGMNPGRRPRRPIEQFQRAREVEIGIGGDQLRGRDAVQWLGDQNGSGARLLHLVGVLGIGEKGELIRGGLFHPCHACNFNAVFTPVNLAPQGRR